MPTDLLAAARVFQIPGPDQQAADPDTARPATTTHPGPVPPTPFSSAAAPQVTPERAVTEARAQTQLPAAPAKTPARTPAKSSARTPAQAPARAAARTVIPAAARALGAVLPEGTLRPEPGLAARWAAEVAAVPGDYKVAVHWGGVPADRRAVPLESFARLAAIPR